MTREEWRVIKDFPDYAISDEGIVKRIRDSYQRQKKAGRIIKPEISKNGYFRVSLTGSDGCKKKLSVHRLMLQAFIDNPLMLPQCNHKNGKKLDNCISNLEWCTPSQNQKHSVDTGLRRMFFKKGEANLVSKLKDGEVWLIKELLATGKLQNIFIAKMFLVSDGLITMIKKGRRWGHIKLQEDTL